MFGLGSKDEDNNFQEASPHHKNLRSANEARQKLWEQDNPAVFDFSWRTNELAGEVGELCNVLKKLHRERVGIPGSRATMDDLADELADVVICIDLVGMTTGIPTLPYFGTTTPGITFGTLTNAGNSLTARCGAVSALNFIEHEAQTLEERLKILLKTVRALAHREAIDLRMAVQNKFNLTSRKMGYAVFLGIPD